LEWFSYGGEVLGQQYGAANTTLPIWLNNVECEGEETSILQCGYSGLNRGDAGCTHDGDASLRCYTSPPSTPPLTTLPQVTGAFHFKSQILSMLTDFFCSDGSLRLYGGPSAEEGWLQVYHEGEWGTFCGIEYFKNRMARLACNDLGFS
jgi:deleted-in-malignant-brain-tumors protein 1